MARVVLEHVAKTFPDYFGALASISAERSNKHS